MPTVEIEGFGRVKFPDDMTPDQIDSAIRTQIMRSPEYVSAKTQEIQQKYDTLTKSDRPTPSNGITDFAKGLLGGIYNTVKHYGVDLPNEYHAAVQQKLDAGDYTGALSTAVTGAVKLATPGVTVAKDLASAQLDQGKQAVDAARNGNYSEAAGRGLAAVTPLFGPAAAHAGDTIGSGRYAEGVGEVTALVAPELARAAGPRLAASPRVRAAGENLAGTLSDSAAADWYKALNPTTKVNKALVENKVAPGLADRGVTARSLDDLRDKAQSKIEEYGQQIDDIFDQKAAQGATLNPKPILDQLENAKQEAMVDGISLNEPYTKKLTALQQQLQTIADKNGGQVPLAKLRKVRQVHDTQVAQSKGGFALAPDAQSQVAAIKEYADAIRSTFADNVRGLADVNGEYSFWRDVDKVAGDTQMRRVGQRGSLTEKMAQLGGATVGAHIAGPGGALAGAETAGKLARLQNSVIWRSISAEAKSRIADLLDSGKAAEAWELANRAALAAAGAGRGAALGRSTAGAPSGSQ